MPTIRDTPLVGSAEAAKLLDIGPTNFSHLRKKMEDAGDESFPTPITKLQCGPIWLESDMVKFKKHYDARRRRVRPAATNGDASVVETPVAATPAPKAVAKKVAAKPIAAKAKATKATASVTDIKAAPKKLVRAGVAS